jgi:hypothetical protein
MEKIRVFIAVELDEEIKKRYMKGILLMIYLNQKIQDY